MSGGCRGQQGGQDEAGVTGAMGAGKGQRRTGHGVMEGLTGHPPAVTTC